MSKEIERKFLVKGDTFKHIALRRYEISQAYLSNKVDATVRVRIRDNSAFLTVKGANSGIIRDEWEYPIPVEDARAMMEACCDAVLSKTRYIVPYHRQFWEVDEFHGALNGLVIAEIELSSPDEIIDLPPFVGDEVSDNPAYYNSVLIEKCRQRSVSS